MAATDAYAVPRDLLDVVEQLVRAAIGNTAELNVTGLALPDHIKPKVVGTTAWAPTSAVATWARAELRKVGPA